MLHGGIGCGLGCMHACMRCKAPTLHPAPQLCIKQAQGKYIETWQHPRPCHTHARRTCALCPMPMPTCPCMPSIDLQAWARHTLPCSQPHEMTPLVPTRAGSGGCNMQPGCRAAAASWRTEAAECGGSNMQLGSRAAADELDPWRQPSPWKQQHAASDREQ